MGHDTLSQEQEEEIREIIDEELEDKKDELFDEFRMKLAEHMEWARQQQQDSN
ncbi:MULTISPECIES: hypothetical protein [unclassified Natrinema]|uniref:hypothetical protein n=1 Tax=unclassified Natrinema TaxID=2622230 RepID=UPI00026D4982|nr:MULTISPECIES: hypothetical protein [unclassified Natrinema]AFO57088.1 hypothetical protein NJ7G_1847 [Natrinema sp. J7-2]